MKIITISASHSSLGKTTLARSIRSVLGPERTAALKIGHGEDKGKPEQLFHDVPATLAELQRLSASDIEFVIIESNRIVDHLTPDLALFIDDPDSQPKESAQSALEKAEIVFSRLLEHQTITKVLRKKQWLTGQQATLLETVFADFLQDCKLHELQVRTKLWMEVGGQSVFGHGKYSLLKKIEELQSLNKAAQALEMSYRHAWAYIKSMEDRLGEKILEPMTSGNRKTGSQLSPFARKLVIRYEELVKKLGDIA